MRFRVAMASISTANHWPSDFVVVMVTPVALDTIGYGYHIMYVVLSACIPVLVYFFTPETMNRNLELLNHVFRDASSPWQIVSMARHLRQGEVTVANVIAQNEQADGCSVEMKENAWFVSSELQVPGEWSRNSQAPFISLIQFKVQTDSEPLLPPGNVPNFGSGTGIHQ